jgi:hypothetical protein
MRLLFSLQTEVVCLHFFWARNFRLGSNFFEPARYERVSTFII